MERHNEVHTDLADEGVIKDEVLVNEVARQFCFPCGGGINCVSVFEDLGRKAF